MSERRFEELFTVHVYKYATWRYAIGHPRSGEVSNVERFEHLPSSMTYLLDRATSRIRVG